METPFRIENMRETLKLLAQQLEKSIDNANQLEDKAKYILSGGTALLGFLGTQIGGNPTLQFQVGLGISVLFYGGTISTGLYVLRPMKYVQPSLAEWDNISSYWHLDDYNLLAQLTVDYIEAVNTNVSAQ